nr:1,2-phenylacetyl-CoA epoxidase subunit B [Leucobacter coleopterorum]
MGGVYPRESRTEPRARGITARPDEEMALRNARDLYTRRNEGVSIWVVPAAAITTSDPDSKGVFFESPAGKNYRHAVYYTLAEG